MLFRQILRAVTRKGNCYLLVLLLSPAALHAHPVSFQGAWSIMSFSQPEMSDRLLNYSVTSRFAVAVRHIRLMEDEGLTDYDFYLPQANFLLQRWNNPGSQGNIYLSGGYGTELINGKEAEDVGLIDIKADWESRKYYIDAEYVKLLRERDSATGDLELRKLRLGFAPYLGEYAELNTWFIVQFDQKKYAEAKAETVETTPLLRFYYRNVLWEVGSSLEGNWLFNFMIHI